MNKGDTKRLAISTWNHNHYFTCMKCGRKWTSYKDKPTICPKCKTKKWKGDAIWHIM